MAWQDLEGEPLIRISAEAGNRALIDEALGGRRDLMIWQYEVQHVATAISLVRAGLGLAIVPNSGFQAAGGAGTSAVSLRSPFVTRTLGIVTRRGNPPSASVALLMKLFRDNFASLSLRRSGK